MNFFLKQTIAQTGIPEVEAINLLVDASIISDHCQTVEDVARVDSFRAASWIRAYADHAKNKPAPRKSVHPAGGTHSR